MDAVADNAKSTRPRRVTAMAVATAILRVANSVAIVKRSAADPRDALPTSHPTANDTTTNAAPVHHVAEVADKGSGVFRDDKRDERADCDKPTGSQRRMPPHRHVRPAAANGVPRSPARPASERPQNQRQRRRKLNVRPNISARHGPPAGSSPRRSGWNTRSGHRERHGSAGR